MKAPAPMKVMKVMKAKAVGGIVSERPAVEAVETSEVVQKPKVIKVMKAKRFGGIVSERPVGEVVKTGKVIQKSKNARVFKPKMKVKNVKTVKPGKHGKAPQANLIAERTKELKGMKVPDLKELVLTRGLEKGLKEEMIASILGLEARLREEAAAQEAKVNAILDKKRQELFSKSVGELKDMLEVEGLKLGGAKNDRVERLLEYWRGQGEVEKALAAEARVARKEALDSMEKTALKELCDKAGIDALIKEVLVERILMRESMDAA